MTSGDAPAEFGAFLDVHWMILTDPTLSETPKRIIAEQHLQRRMGADAADRTCWSSSSTRSRTRTCASARPTSCRWSSACSRCCMGKRGGGAARQRRGADDPGRARSFAGRRDPVQEPPFRRVPDRSGRRHLAHRDRRAQPQRAGGRGDAQRARADPRERAADRRRRQERRHRQSRSLGARRVPAEAGRVRARAQEAQAAEDDAAPRRSTAPTSSCSPTSSCPTISTQALENGAAGVGLVPQRVPVSQSPGTAVGGRAVRGVPAGRRRHGRQAGHDSHVRSGRRQAARKASTGWRASRRIRRWACARCASASPSRGCS